MVKEELKRVKKAWGWELWVVNSEYCGKLLFVDKGASSSRHAHMYKKETFFCLYGAATLTVGQEQYDLNPFARPKTILPGQVHSFTAQEDTLIMEVSWHHSEIDVFRESMSTPGPNPRTWSQCWPLRTVV